MLSLPLFLGFAAVAVVGLALLKKTRWFWIPGIAFVAYGAMIYLGWPSDERHGEGSGFVDLSRLIQVAASVGVIVSGLVCLIVGARSRRRARRAHVPRAIVVKG